MFSPGILPVCLLLITSNMHTNALNNLAHEIYICSGLLIYSLSGIVLIFFFPITKQLLMLQMWSEDLNIPWVCNGMLVAIPVPFLEWGWSTHRTTLHLQWSAPHPLTSPETFVQKRTSFQPLLSLSCMLLDSCVPFLFHIWSIGSRLPPVPQALPVTAVCPFTQVAVWLSQLTAEQEPPRHQGTSHLGIGLEGRSVT